MTVTSDEALAELGFLCQRMTYVCHNGTSGSLLERLGFFALTPKLLLSEPFFSQAKRFAITDSTLAIRIYKGVVSNF